MENKYPLEKLTVALVSPNDPVSEGGFDRKKIQREIKAIDYDGDGNYNILYDVKLWHDDPMRVIGGGRGQETVDEFIGEANIVIGIFCNKIGTEYKGRPSATVHELYNAVLRRISKKHGKKAPYISVYFLKSKKSAGEFEKNQLESLLEVHKLKETFESYGLFDYASMTTDGLIKAIKENLREHAKIYRGVASRYTKESERLTFIGNLITQKVIAYLEMDRGYSEIAFKLFDSFKFGDDVLSEYSTNLVFDYGALCSDSLLLLRQSFDNEFANFICDNLEIHSKQKLYHKISPDNFSDIATVVNVYGDDVVKDAFSYQSLFAANESNLVKSIATTLNAKFYDDSVRNIDNKALVFMVANLTESFLQNVEIMLSKIASRQSLPEVFLFSILPIPRSEEIEHHIKNIKVSHRHGDNCEIAYPCLCSCLPATRPYVISYLTKEDHLDDGEGNGENFEKKAKPVFKLIYGKEVVVGGKRK